MTALDLARQDLDRARRDLRHAVQRQRRDHHVGEPECPVVLAAHEAVEVCAARVKAAEQGERT